MKHYICLLKELLEYICVTSVIGVIYMTIWYLTGTEITLGGNAVMAFIFCAFVGFVVWASMKSTNMLPDHRP